MNNLGEQTVCNGCLKSIIDSLICFENVRLIITSHSSYKKYCTIEDGKLGGKCFNPANYHVTIEEMKNE